MWRLRSQTPPHWQHCFDVLIFFQSNGNWHGRSSPLPGASPHSDHSENSDWWPCPAGPERQRRKVWWREGKKKTERMNSHFPLGCSCFCTSFCLFVFIYFNCTLFCFIVCRFLNARHRSLLLFVCWAECADGRVETCACWCGFIIMGLVGLVFHYFGHVTDLCVCGRVWGGRGAGLHYHCF